MRKAEDFVAEYRRKGYPDDRIRIIASMRPEPLRSEVLRILDTAQAGAAQATPPGSHDTPAESSKEAQTPDSEESKEVESAFTAELESLRKQALELRRRASLF